MNVNCGGSSGGGTGGTTSTGGKGGTGTGGTSTGGAAGSGTSTGGTAGSGTGGTAGSGTGGTAGGGGANTDGGTQQYAAFSFTFDKDTQGWGFNTNDKPTDGSVNLSLGDAGSPPTLTWDSAVGDPTNGSLEINATFSGYRQFVQTAVGIKTTVDATGRTASAWVMLDKQDGGSALPVGAQLEFNSGASYNGFAGTSYTSLTPGTWTKLSLPLTASSAFDPTQIVQVAVQFITESQPDGGAAFGAPVHATFHVDTVTDGSGLPLPPPVDFTFDTSLQGFSLSDSGFTPDGGTAPTLTFDSAAGDPAGSAKLVIPFTGYNEQLDTQFNLSPTADLTGKTLHAKVRLDSGTFTSGYINLHVSGPDYAHYEKATTGSINASGLTAGQWVDLSITLSAITDTGFDPAHILQVGIQFGTGSGPDGGVFPTSTQPVTFHIDSIIAQ
jgi:hypothetical protein